MRHERRPPSVPSFHDEGHGYDVFGLRPAVMRRVERLWRPIYDHYFRVRSQGHDHIPAHGAAILVANHGGALPVDAFLLCLDVLRHTARTPRPIVERFIPLVPFINTLFARIGAVTGTRANVARLLERGELIAIWPEGVTGMAKPFRQRYQLQDWRVGHAELAIRHRAPIVPAAVIGAEESWPVVTRVRGFHGFGAPFLPVPLSPLPLPVQHRIRYGAPIELHRDFPPDAADDPAVVAAAAARIRAAVEALIADERAARRGRRA